MWPLFVGSAEASNTVARVLIRDEWFEPLSPSAIYESEFEAQIVERAELFYPQYLAMPFKLTVFSEDGSARADFALVHRRYKDWWVVEVEMGYHSFEGHVVPQVRTLSRAAYGEKEAAYLCGKCEHLDAEKTRALMKGRQPRVLVIVNQSMPSWVHELRRFNALVNILEVFRSRHNEYVFRMNGEVIAVEREILSECTLDPILPRFLIVHSPGTLPFTHGQTAIVFVDGKVTEWERVDSHDKVWLSPKRENPLSPGRTYELIRQELGDLTIRPSIEKRRRN